MNVDIACWQQRNTPAVSDMLVACVRCAEGKGLLARCSHHR